LLERIAVNAPGHNAWSALQLHDWRAVPRLHVQPYILGGKAVKQKTCETMPPSGRNKQTCARTESFGP
jgi:hypothetical protein